MLLARLMSSANYRTDQPAEGDRLLSVPEASAILGKTVDDIYRHDYAFKVKDRRGVKCSFLGVQEYIRQLKRAR